MNAGFSSSRLRVLAISAGLISPENTQGISERQQKKTTLIIHLSSERTDIYGHDEFGP
jgi:hypothetical protein